MSGKGSGPVSTFSFRDLPLLGFLVCLGFFLIIIFLKADTLFLLFLCSGLALNYRYFNDESFSCKYPFACPFLSLCKVFLGCCGASEDKTHGFLFTVVCVKSIYCVCGFITLWLDYRSWGSEKTSEPGVGHTGAIFPHREVPVSSLNIINPDT